MRLFVLYYTEHKQQVKLKAVFYLHIAYNVHNQMIMHLVSL